MFQAIRRCAIGICVAFAAASAQADTFPSRPIRIIVPSPPGMGIDVITRYVGERLALAVGQQVVIDNRPGAGGVLAAITALNAQPDGYTLVALATPMTIQMSLQPKPPFDLTQDFAHIAYLGSTPQVLVTSGKSPFKSFKEYLAAARSQELNVGAASTLSASHLAMETWRLQSGVKLNLVPYKGSGDAQLGLASGDIAVMFDSLPAVLPFVRSGQVRALAVGSPQRVPAFPDVPTIAELGYPSFAAVSWIGYSASIKIPAPVVQRLSDEFRRIFADPQTRERLAALGFYPAEMTRDQYAAYVRQEVDRWGQVVRAANLKVQ